MITILAMIQRSFLHDFLTLAVRSDQVSDVLHIVSQASHPAVTSSACCDSVTPNGWSSVSAIRNVTLHVARSLSFRVGNIHYKNKCEGPPHQGLSLGTAGQDGFNISLIKTAAQEAPSGAAAFIVFGGMGASAPIFIFYPIK